MRASHPIALVLTLALLPAAVARAQTKVTGVVRGSDGQVLAGATVELVRNQFPVASTETDRQGRYSIGTTDVMLFAVEAIRVSLPGFKIVTEPLPPKRQEPFVIDVVLDTFGCELGGDVRCMSADVVRATIPLAYQRFYAIEVDADSERAGWDAIPCDSIRLAIDMGLVAAGPDTNRVYMLQRGGRATRLFFVAGKERSATGTIDAYYYARLCYAAEQIGFDGMPSGFESPGTDSPSATVTIVTRGVEKSVYDDAAVGPIGLWTLEQAIENVGRGITWTPR